MDYEVLNINNAEVLYNFNDVSIIEKLLLLPENKLFLYKRDIKTNEITQENDFDNLTYVPNIEIVIKNKGYEIHTFNECLEIYNDAFITDNKYLPFDNDEIYITKDDRYEGCCTKNGFEFTTNDYHYFYGIKRIGGN